MRTPVLLQANTKTLLLFAKRLRAAGILPDADPYFAKIDKHTKMIIYWPHCKTFGAYHVSADNIYDGPRFRASKFNQALNKILKINKVLTINKLNND